MSWKHAPGKLVSGPPSASTGTGSNRLDPRFRNNTGGLSAFQREQQFAAHYGSKEGQTAPEGKTEWDVLRENHRRGIHMLIVGFIRDDEEPSEVSWEERLARAYESKLFKEFALIDLKHFKSKRLALRWRTAPEVVDGIGEDTCASLRCKYHQPLSGSSLAVDFDQDDESEKAGSSESRRRRKRRRMPPLRSFELPFVYEEAGERKEALVKVRLCPKCEAKLLWRPGREEVSEESDDVSDKEAMRDARRKRHERRRSASPSRHEKRRSSHRHRD